VRKLTQQPYFLLAALHLLIDLSLTPALYCSYLYLSTSHLFLSIYLSISISISISLSPLSLSIYPTNSQYRSFPLSSSSGAYLCSRTWQQYNQTLRLAVLRQRSICHISGNTKSWEHCSSPRSWTFWYPDTQVPHPRVVEWHTMKFSSNGKHILLSTHENTIFLIDAFTGEKVRQCSSVSF